MLTNNIEEEYILGDMIKCLLNSTKNSEYELIYNTFKSKYEFIKNYSFIIGTNDETKSDFYTTILSTLNSKKFYDYDGKEITVEHHFSSYKNILYFTDKPKNKIYIDSSVYLDSNSANIFERFYKQNIPNDFIDFKINNNIDLNYLPYMMEDYINPHHNKKNIKRTLEKIKIIEIINNLDISSFKKNGILEEDKLLLQKYGFNDIDELLEDKIFYFNTFIDKMQHKYKKINLKNSKYFMYQSDNKFDIYSILSEYYLIFGYILKILIEKRKTLSVEDKVENLFHEMVCNGRNFKHILEFSYDYFDDDRKVNLFFNYDNKWSYKQIIEETYNKAWDIFLYFITQQFITNPKKRFENSKADLGISFFLTKDNKFYKTFVDGYRKKIFIINETLKHRPFNTINEPTKRSKKVEQIMMNYYEKNENNFEKLKIKRGKLAQKYQYSMSIIFKEQMERELKNYF